MYDTDEYDVLRTRPEFEFRCQECGAPLKTPPKGMWGEDGESWSEKQARLVPL